MEIRVNQENNQIILIWEYKLKKKIRIINEVEYHYYSATFPTELQQFLDTKEVWLKEEEGQVYILPSGEEGTKKCKLSKNSRFGFVFSLSRKMFSRIDEMNHVRIVFDGVSIMLSLF